MTTVNPSLSNISGEGGLRWGILGEYGYSIVILFHVVYFLPIFITTGICIKT